MIPTVWRVDGAEKKSINFSEIEIPLGKKRKVALENQKNAEKHSYVIRQSFTTPPLSVLHS